MTKLRPPYAHTVTVDVRDRRVVLVLHGRGRVLLATAVMLPAEAAQIAQHLADHALEAVS